MTTVADPLGTATDNPARSNEVTFMRAPAILFFLRHPGKQADVSVKKSCAWFLARALAPGWRITSAMQAGKRGRSFRSSARIISTMMEKKLKSRMHALTDRVGIAPPGLEKLVADIGAFAQVMPAQWVRALRETEPWR